MRASPPAWTITSRSRCAWRRSCARSRTPLPRRSDRDPRSSSDLQLLERGDDAGLAHLALREPGIAGEHAVLQEVYLVGERRIARVVRDEQDGLTEAIARR